MDNRPLGGATLSDHAFALLQRVLPTRWLSMWVYRVTRIRHAGFKNALIRVFMQRFNISLAEAELERPESFGSFNEFFTRALKPGARPADPHPQALVSPADGRVSQLGRIEGNRIFQAKGREYTVEELLGGDKVLAKAFLGGEFCTIYLAPNNYHRMHMPATGVLREWIYVPGRLFSVNPATARALPKVFARNERVVTVFDTPAGPLAMVLVGALFVGSIETVWAGQITPPHRRSGIVREKPVHPVMLDRSDEFGRFNMGSTVILLGAPGTLRWAEGLGPNAVLSVGQAIGYWQTQETVVG